MEIYTLTEEYKTFILNKFAELQNFITGLTVQDGVIASADVILLAAGVVIFLGVAVKHFLKKQVFQM